MVLKASGERSASSSAAISTRVLTPNPFSYGPNLVSRRSSEEFLEERKTVFEIASSKISSA